MNVSVRDAVIVDVDGTLCDVSSIQHFVAERPRDFDAFYRASAGCPAHEEVVREIADARDRGLAVLIVTGRQRRWRELTEAWLADHGVEYDQLYLRGDRDFRPDVAFKTDVLDWIRKDGYRPVHAWDDRPGVIKLWERHGISTTTVGA